MGQNTRPQGLAAFKFNMAAHFGHARIPQKNSAFLHNLETCHELEIVLRYHLERCIAIPSYFTTTTEWQNKWPFYEKEEAYK